MRTQANISQKSSPVVRVRLMVTGMAALVALFGGPMLLVWKQVYIADVSMRIEALTDTLSAQNHQIAALRLVCDRMSSNARIESFARSVLKLDYPSSDRIVIVAVEAPPKKRSVVAEVAQLFAAVQDRHSGKGGEE